MPFHRSIYALVFILTGCSNLQHDTDSGKSLIKYSSGYITRFPSVEQSLASKNMALHGGYYTLAKFSDSTVQINWGNDSVCRIYHHPLDFRNAERLSIAWENNDFLILRYGVGSGAWENIVLPLNNRDSDRLIDNALCFDTANNLLVSQQSTDTILLVQNLQTLQRQYIWENELVCVSANPLFCIDSIGIRDKILYYRWVTAYPAAANKKITEKRIRLKI